MSERIKVACQMCGGRISYLEEQIGQIINCPHCQREIRLVPSFTAAKKQRPLSAAVIVGLLIVILGVLGGVALTSRQRKVEAEIGATQAKPKEKESTAAEALTPASNPLPPVTPSKEPEVALAKNEEVEVPVERDLEAEAEVRREQEARERAKQNPALLALWEENDRDSIRLVATKASEITASHKGKTLTAKYEDLPKWLRDAARKKHKDDGEAKGLIREVEGVIYDLRTAPAGWVSLPLAEVFQIIEDGYLLMDVTAPRTAFAQAKVFKLKHNGMQRILNTGDRVQTSAKSVGTYRYQTKSREIKIVPVYDPGLPVGPLRAKSVTIRGTPVRRTSPAIFSQMEPSGSGSGFFISDDGLFITNAHVVDEADKVEVRTAAGKKAAKVLRVDDERDLALLKVSVEAGEVSALNIATNRIALGTEVFTIGYPLVELQGSKPKYTDGKVSSIAGVKDDPNEMQISVAVQPGNSGGPLADINGDIVGVVVARLNDVRVMEIAGAIPQNVNYAIKGTTLLQFLNENRALSRGVRFGRSSSRSPEDAITHVERASGLVLVFEEVSR